jgi:hypothetical protein
MTCPECGHPLILEHGPDETCFDCDELAQLGQYAPCADPGLCQTVVTGG